MAAKSSNKLDYSPLFAVLFNWRDAADALAQFLTRLEVRDMLGWQSDRITRFGVTSQARWTIVQRKTTESTDFDAIALRQRSAHHLQQRLDGEIDVFGLQVRLAAGQDF